MDAKRRPPPIPEKTVAGMPPAKPPVPGPPPPNQLESQAGRKEVEGEGPARGGQGAPVRVGSSSSKEGAETRSEGCTNERFDPPVGGQFTSPAVALMDPMKKARRKTAHPPYANQQQQQSGIQRGASPSQGPSLPFGGGGVPVAGVGNKSGTISASSSNGFHVNSDGTQLHLVQHTAAIQQQTQSQAQKQLRSPSVKRAPGSFVTMQGWLHKQGSDGLMLWKRRWFVLSEFCLFYYKGPDEEKVLGSILLPSYVISPCTSDERKRGGNRKHSFKAEHHNMRTYYFAADTLELMERWIHVMNLASLLQKDFTSGPNAEGVSWDERQSGRPSVSSFSSLLNQSADDSDSGFHGGRSPKHATIAVGAAATPNQALAMNMWNPKVKKLDEETLSEISRERDAAAVCRKGASPEVPPVPGEFQPLYANAPPKPRRLNSSGRDYSTSPERSPERKVNEDSVVLRSRVPFNEPVLQNGMYVDRGQRASRPTVAFASIRHERNITYQQQPPLAQPQQLSGNLPPSSQTVFPVVDRRTPDTYGRSNTADGSSAGVAKIVQNRVDYEDVYSVSQNSDALGRLNRWSSGQYDTHHFPSNDIHQNAVQPIPPTHVHHCPSGGHSPQQGHQLHPHSQQQLAVVQRMPIQHPYSVSPTTAQHQHPTPSHLYPNPHQLMPPQPQPQVVQRRTPPLPRPHSADFLGHYEQNQITYVLPLSPNVGSATPSMEQASPKMPSPAIEDTQPKPRPSSQMIEVRERHTVDIYHGQQMPRPKSSMDIRPYNQERTFDPADYWSEESYARMMRQSLYLHSQHVHPSPSSSHKGSETSSGLSVPQQQQSWPSQPQEAIPTIVTQQPQVRPSQVAQKQPTCDALEVWGKGTEDSEVANQNRQSAIVGKRDLHQAGQFLRSASARVPRSRYNSGENPGEPLGAMSAASGEEVRYGERKMQQREESMRRLLEWKQRMLQSPLTRKTSSSSGPRKSTQDPSSHNSSQMGSPHYKQMILKQLASQEAAASSNNWEHSSRRVSSRRGPDDVRTARSRSHDGRRSSASLSRYNSYSSDDEEAMGESRKRVRVRGNQAGKGRRGVGGVGGEETSATQNPPSTAPTPLHHKTSSPPKSQSQPHNHHHHHPRPTPLEQNGGFQNVHHHHNQMPSDPSGMDLANRPHKGQDNFGNAKSPVPFECEASQSGAGSDGGGIPPDASYADVESSSHLENWWGVRNGRTHKDEGRSNRSDPQSVTQQDMKRLHLEDETSKYGRETMSGLSKPLTQSGSENKNTRDDLTAYSIEFPEIKSNSNNETSNSETTELDHINYMNDIRYQSGLLKQLADQQKGKFLLPTEYNYNEEIPTSKLKSRKTLLDLRSKRENPPKNIVQNRIKAFEPKDDELKDVVKKLPTIPDMKDPIKELHSSYTYNEAQMSSLWGIDNKQNEDGMMHFKKRDNPASSFVNNNGGAAADVESSDDGSPSSPPPPLPISPPPALPSNKATFDPNLISNPSSSSTPKGSNLNTKSVRELLADFERKSEEKKKMLEMENQHNEGTQLGGEIADVGVDGDRYYHGRRCVFSDTETLLYETGSDMDEEAEMIRRWKAQKEELARASEHATERRAEKGETQSIPSKEPTEEGDSEVESALRMNGVTISNCSGKALRNSCSPLTGKNVRMENGNGNMTRVKDISMPPPPTECKIRVEADEPMEVITTPGYLRLSLAESLVTHEDLISPFGSSATTTPPLPNTPSAPEEEQHYMPMTPSRKSILASPSSIQQTGASPTSASHSIIMESVFGSNGTFWTQLEAEEESSYVEMTEEGLVKSLLVSDSLGSSPLAPLSIFASPSGRVGLELCRKSSGESTATYAVPDSPRYSEIPGGTIFDSAMARNPSAHYELLSRATTLYEPVYMEVRSLKEGGNALEEDAKSRLKKEKEESSEDGKVLKTSEEEHTFRKEKKKKSKASASDIDEATNSSKSDNFGDRKISLPLDPHRMAMGGILPDILNGSSNANNCHILEGIGTDSSDVGDEDEEDADDEASKDLDSLDAPRHPRFSLSDTFRPASYYLGASDRNFSAGGSSKIGLTGGDSGTVGRGLMDMVAGVDPSANELHGDSSDSDLVSPPPIPTSPPPPLEEDDDDDLAESLEESDDRKSGKTLSLSTQSNTSGTLRNPSPGQRSVISPASVQPEGSSMSDMSDTASTVCSLRRRPVTGNILDSLINSASNKSDIPTELYMRRNEMMNEYSDYKRSVDFNSPLSPSLPPELWPRLEDGLPSVSPEALHRRIASADDAAVLYENVPMRVKPKIKSSAMQEAARLSHSPHRSSSPFVQLPENQSPPQPNLAAVKTIIPPNSEQLKNFVSGTMMSPDGETPAGAPYYYSDIIRGECEDLGFMSSSSERSVTRNSMHAPGTSWRPSRIPLNNQRDDVQETAAKRNDVGRKVNRIQTPGEAFHNVGRHHDMQRAAMADCPRENCEGVDKIMAADLILIGADKRVDVDERNIYETDTLKKAARKRQSKEQPNWDNTASGQHQPYHQVDPPYHRRCYTPDSLPDSRSSRNIYPYGLVDKSSDGAFLGNPNDLQFSQQNGVGERANRWRRRSRSLEGLLDDDSESPFQQNLVQTPLSSMATGHIRQAPLTFDNSQGNTWGNPIPATPEVVLDTSPGSRSGINTSSNSNFNGVDPWSEDSLWRESLRRVSLRHTRSLDHLDDCAVPSANQVCPSGRRSVDLLAAGNSEAARKSKVSRGVTYVNDSVAIAAERRNRMRLGHKPDQFPPANSGETSGEGSRQGRRGIDGLLGDPRQRGSGGQFDRHSPRQAQEMENSQGAKSLPKDSYDHTGGPRGSRRRGGQVEHTENLPSSEHHFLGEDAPPSPPQSPQPQEPGPGFEIDREKLRQWDLMSSAPLPGMVAGVGGGGGAGTGAPGGKAGAVRRVAAALEGGAEGGGGGAETAGPVARGVGVLPRADETEARGGDETTARMDGEVPDGQARKPLQQQELRTSTHQSAGTASGTGSIREPAPTRHSKNDTSTTMLIISQPTPIPIPSPSFVQPPNTRVGPPALKQHGVLPNGVETEMGSGDMEGGGPRRWRGNEGAVVGKAVPMLRWEKEGAVEPMRRHPPEDQPASEGDFLALQRGSRRRLVPPPWICQCIKLWKQNAPTKHENTNGGVVRGKKSREQGEGEKNRDRNKGDRGRGEVSVSAGDLLGRTHEELVLLLIQLRRQSAAVSNAIDLCQADVRAQARLAELEMHRRVEHLKKLEELKKHLLELEKQYEKGKPLINLVDNMVKLGSLYRGNTDAQGQVKSWRSTGGDTMTGPSPAKDRLQFNQRVQEQRLLAEERRDWSRLSPDHGELQAKVQQLYRLDRLLQEESVTIQSLQQDKELLEKALGGLRHKLQGSAAGNSGNLSGTSPRDSHGTKGGANTSVVDPAEAERYRKQQRMLERELSRVRQLLAQNSKKLEETVAENARLEQELVVLRQKLQLSRRTIDTHATSPSPSSSITNAASPSGATASLEAELRRVQSAVGDLQRQRHELSVQVRQLTEKSHSLVEQIRPGPTGVAGAGPIPAKKRHHSTWMVTDLDSMESIDCGIESPGQGLSPSRGLPMMQSLIHSPMESTPLYVNTTLGQHGDREDAGRRAPLEDSQAMANGYELVEAENSEEAQGYQAMDISEADDRMKRFYGIIPREKTEIKTVRIVKRESERRHRDRTSKRVVLVEDPGDSATSPSSTLNRVLEEEVAEGDEGVEEEEEDRGEAEAMATYHHHQQMHHHHHQQPQQQQLTPTTPLASSSVPYSSSFLTSPEDDPILSQFFQRSMSLPRALGKQRSHNQPPPIPPPPPLRVASPRGSSAAVRRQQLMHRRSDAPDRPRSAHEQLFGATSQDEQHCMQQPPPPISFPAYSSYSPSPSSHSASPTLYSPTERSYPPIPPTPDSPPLIAFKSEAAREIAMEMAALHSGEDWANGGRGSVKKRATPKEKRRHYTVSCSRPLDLESIVIPKMGSARSRDDLDMEQVLRPRLNAPDVVRSTMSHRDFKYNEHTIDSVIGTPNKIVIPERYIPEQAPELSEEEQMHRLKKAEAIRKMLSETTPITAPEVEDNQHKKTSIIKKKVAEEKRQRDHILQLNQILAKQVMEKSKMVAVRALATLPLHDTSTDDDELSSPVQPLPLTQQRDNFFS